MAQIALNRVHMSSACRCRPHAISSTAPIIYPNGKAPRGLVNRTLDSTLSGTLAFAFTCEMVRMIYLMERFLYLKTVKIYSSNILRIRRCLWKVGFRTNLALDLSHSRLGASFPAGASSGSDRGRLILNDPCCRNATHGRQLRSFWY